MTPEEQEHLRQLRRHLRYLRRQTERVEEWLAAVESCRAFKGKSNLPECRRRRTLTPQRRLLAYLDRRKAFVKDILAGRLPFDTVVPAMDESIVSAVEEEDRWWRSTIDEKPEEGGRE
jgi:hypothetical protein